MRKTVSSKSIIHLTKSASFAAAASSELTCRKSIHGLPHPFSTTISGTDTDSSLRSSWMPAIASTISPPASAAFRRIPQCCDTKKLIEFKDNSLCTDNTAKIAKGQDFHLLHTFEASATISGSSLAVTSFKAGNEFATKTTCAISILLPAHFSVSRYIYNHCTSVIVK
jgi:hypothetical protein